MSSACPQMAVRGRGVFRLDNFIFRRARFDLRGPPALWIPPAQIDEEAAKVGRGATLSGALRFSSPELQDEFHRWMAGIPAVRWHPLLVFGLQLAIPFWFLSRDTCGPIHVLAAFPALCLVTARVALELGGCRKQAQSLCSLIFMAYGQIVIVTAAAAKDTCYLSMGPNGASLAATVAFVPMGILANHVITPCTMQHVPALCGVVGVGSAAFSYMKFLQQNGGLNPEVLDPYLLKLTAVVFSSVFGSLLVYCARVYLTRDVMILFLQSLGQRD